MQCGRSLIIINRFSPNALTLAHCYPHQTPHRFSNRSFSSAFASLFYLINALVYAGVQCIVTVIQALKHSMCQLWRNGIN